MQLSFPNAAPNAAKQIQQTWDGLKTTTDKASKIAGYKVNNKTYFSTLSLLAHVEEIDAVTGKYALVFEPQMDTAFDYRMGETDTISGSTRKMSYAETNMSEPNSPDGSNEMAILALGARCRAITPVFAPATTALYTHFSTAALSCLTGGGIIADPYALIAPGICGDPGLLENAIFQAICSQSSFKLEFDHGNSLSSYLGTLADIPQGGASSFLHAHGDPTFRNRFELGSGIYWRSEGSRQGMSKLLGKVEVHNRILVPFTAAATGGSPAFAVPTAVYAEIVMAVMGIEYSPLA
jgi:hypothetical protein